MKIGILILMAGRKAAGPETYEVELLRALAKIDKHNEYIIYCTGKESIEAVGVTQNNFSYHILQPGFRPLSIALTLPIRLIKDRVDFLHSTFTPPPWTSKPEVLTVHCLSSFAHPEFYSPLIAYRLNTLLWLGMRRAKRILCVSQTTADDISKRFGISKDKLMVTYNGASQIYFPVPREEACRKVSECFGIFGPFALFLGKIEPRKNVVRLIEAFAKFHHESQSETKLVLAGPMTTVTPEINELIIRLGIESSVIQLGYISSDIKSSLYSASRMFLFPSLWEGFGIPLVEAMACGTPVLTSNVTCIPEIVGGAALIVDPNCIQSIADGIAQLDASDTFRNKFVSLGLERVKHFTWENAAKKTLMVYESMRCISTLQ